MMERDTRQRLAELLRAAADQSVTEETFWRGFDVLSAGCADGRLREAYNAAIHFWGNFHSRNLLLMRMTPRTAQLENDAAEIREIADAIEQDWPLDQLRDRLKDGV